jgi:hypothetical protein
MSPKYTPIEGVRLSWWWRETMTQHSRDMLPDLSGDTAPPRTGPKCEWLWRISAERRREELQRLDVGVIHDLTPPCQPNIAEGRRKS